MGYKEKGDEDEDGNKYRLEDDKFKAEVNQLMKREEETPLGG